MGLERDCTGLVGLKVASFSPTHTADKLVIPASPASKARKRGAVGRALGIAVLGAVGWAALAGRAEGGPMDDGVPSGTVAFFSGGACPAGWQTAASVQGRLVVGVVDGSRVGMQVGTPLGDQEDRQHQHAYTASVTLGSDNVAGADGPNQSGAAAQAYMVTGTTDAAATALPFVQVQPCVKQ